MHLPFPIIIHMPTPVTNEIKQNEKMKCNWNSFLWIKNLILCWFLIRTWCEWWNSFVYCLNSYTKPKGQLPDYTIPRSSCNLIGALWRNSVTNSIAPFSRNSNNKLILYSYLMVLYLTDDVIFWKISLQCFGMGIFCEASTAESRKGSRS